MRRAERFESIDSRLALYIYAAVVGLGGFALAGWGQLWLGSHLVELPWGRAVLIRMAGALMIGAALCAVGLASTDILTRRRGLSWFIAAHAVVWLMLEIQIRGPLGDVGVARRSSYALLAVILALLYVRLASEPGTAAFLRTRREEDSVRARYEREIREAAAQEERNRLARDLHDAVKQQIFAIQTSAATAEARFEADRPGTRDALAHVRQSAREAMAEMEALLEQLRVAPIGNTGLVEAVRKQCEALALRTGAKVDVQIAHLPSENALAPGTHQAIFRVVQEALANVGRHARAHHVWVSVGSTAGVLRIEIQDDGGGIQAGTRLGMGVRNMKARAAEIGGTLDVGQADAQGTIVTLTVPLESPDASAGPRNQALRLTVAFGVFTIVTLLNLMENGPVLANVFLLFFALAFVHHARAWWRLRRGGGARATAGWS